MRAKSEIRIEENFRIRQKNAPKTSENRYH
jgi:hypothetical protein